MKHLYFAISLALLFLSCSTGIKKDNDKNYKEQVDLSSVDPLAQFSSNSEINRDFEVFTSYPEKKFQKKDAQKVSENLPKVKYYIQVGITDIFDEITNLKSQIINLFPDEKIEIKYDAPFYRILIGPLESKTEANEIFSILERKNFPSIRIRTETSK